MTSFEILQQIFPGKAAVRLAALAPAIDLAPQTLRNWSSLGTCPFPTRKAGGARVARLQDVADWLDGDVAALPTSPVVTDIQPVAPRRRGAPTKAARLQRGSQGGAQ